MKMAGQTFAGVSCPNSSIIEKLRFVMNHLAPSRNGWRVRAACVCMLAVVLLFAPYAGAAWMSHSMDCCTGDHCDIPQHHHKKAPVHADCDHGSGASECTMSCCQDEERTLLSAVIFVMPPVVTPSASVPSTPAVDAPDSTDIPRSVSPLLQPPRA
jgi:hypothetical protein